MAKKNADQVAASTGAVKSAIDFDNLPGEQSSGRGAILKIEVGEVVGPMVLTRIVPNVLVSDEPGAKAITTYDARDEDGNVFRLPIGAIFLDKMAGLSVSVGDTLYIRREEGVKKERGRGKGTLMADYSIKVTGRANRSA